MTTCFSLGDGPLWVVGISGKIKTGKTLLAEALAAEFMRDGLPGDAVGIVTLNFGDLLKSQAAERFGFDAQLAYSHEGKEAVVRHPDLPQGAATVRGILQWYGTDICRMAEPDYWSRRMADELSQRGYREVGVIIGDVRFADEAELIHKMLGATIRIEPHPGWEPGLYANHRSETALDERSALWTFAVRPFCDPEHCGTHAARSIAEHITNRGCNTGWSSSGFFRAADAMRVPDDEARAMAHRGDPTLSKELYRITGSPMPLYELLDRQAKTQENLRRSLAHHHSQGGTP